MTLNEALQQIKSASLARIPVEATLQSSACDIFLRSACYYTLQVHFVGGLCVPILLENISDHHIDDHADDTCYC